jgi:hypothetical protein
MRLRVIRVVEVNGSLDYMNKYRQNEHKNGLELEVGDSKGYSTRLFIQYSLPQEASSVVGKEVFFWGGEAIEGNLKMV